MYIGKVGNEPVIISEGSPNCSILLTGISGSGKTCRMNQIELVAALHGDTVIILDINQTHEDQQIFTPIYKTYQSLENKIHILKDGIEIQFLKPMVDSSGYCENYVNLVNNIITSLTGTIRFGIKQIGVLRTAVIFAINHSSYYSDAMSAITDGLLRQGSKEAESVYEKLWSVLNCGVFRKSDKQIERGKINILNFAGLDSITKFVLAEIILSYLWRSSQHSGQARQNKIIIVLDEFQNLPLSQGTALRSMLCEGRKFNLSFLMATQSLDFFQKEVIAILNQAAVRLFFKPSHKDMRKIAGMIENSNIELWLECLQSLKVGESIAIGNLKIGQRDVDHPIILK